ncbi:hypothetical protein SNE25_24415 [Mucilaginibacter sabulilitoris]|uniref:Uncharacterized protein n=1 Tax=Mucilaginibacter sabulilitoris TaxID=1173583 RepID=A0ABZ0TI38_9SPHI|nr:hypothetical protein [Mucilaginibacter sabulilitoris]WPU92476.1 hypothetical protein SNE25_24415 [Mucilaginibacter sabulilitoris]
MIDKITYNSVRQNYESLLRVGDYNKYTGYTKGRGTAESTYIEFDVALALATDGASIAAKKAEVLTAEEILVHGNSLKSLRPTWGYKLYTEEGEFLKNGITSKLVPETRYTKSFMMDKKMVDPILFPNRAAADEWEFQQNQIKRGPLSLNIH